MSTAMIWQTASTSSADTERLGQLLGSLIKSPEVIELRSDLGGGKTTFVKGLALGLGSKDVVTSPTFTLNKIYQARGGQQIHHYDFYRLNEAGILSDELAESLSDPKVVTVIEWSKIVQDVLPVERLVIELEMTNEADERQINLRYPSAKTKIVRRLETDWQGTRP